MGLAVKQPWFLIVRSQSIIFYIFPHLLVSFEVIKFINFFIGLCVGYYLIFSGKFELFHVNLDTIKNYKNGLW